MRFGSYGNNNLCARGETSVCSLTESSCPAPYAETYRVCSLLCLEGVVNNFNYRCAYSRTYLPFIFGTQSSNSNVGASTPRNQDRQWMISLSRGNSSAFSSVNYTSPLTHSATVSYGYRNTPLANTQNYIGISATVNYGYSFASWRINSSSGTIATTVNATNIFYNGSYGGSNENLIKFLYAQI